MPLLFTCRQWREKKFCIEIQRFYKQYVWKIEPFVRKMEK